MIRRLASILVIVIALMSFLASSSFAQDEQMPRKKPAKKEHVMKKKAHIVKKHKTIKKGHKMGKKKSKMMKKKKAAKEDSRIKVN